MKPCPICNSTNNLRVTDKEFFERAYEENGGATISIRCWHCGLELWEHSYLGKSYKKKLKILTNKWNNMPRKEQEDDGK